MAYVQKGNPFKQASSGQSLYTVEQTPPIQHINVSNNESPTLRRKSNEPRKTTKGKGRNFRTVKEGAGMTSAGVKKYRSKNPGSKLKTAVTKDPKKLKKGSKAWKRRKSFCARSKGWKGKRGLAARRRWNC